MVAVDLNPGAAHGWIVRHARPLIEPGICYGRSDIAADPGHTLTVAQALHGQLPAEVLLWTSPLSRCTALCEAFASVRTGLVWRIDERLAEMDFGCWEGQRWDTIDRSAFDRWTADFGHERFGGRESVQELLDRVAEALAEVQGLGRPWAWITHAGVIRASSLLIEGRRRVSDSRDWPNDVLPFGCIRPLVIDRLRMPQHG